MANFTGTSGDDSQAGTKTTDGMDYSQGGEDTVKAGGGSDIVVMGAALDSGDRIDGGAGGDFLELQGDYSAGVVFQDSTITGFEIVDLLAGGSYRLAFANGNVAPGEFLAVRIYDTAILDGRDVVDGRLYYDSAIGSDVTLYGGAGDDLIGMRAGMDRSVLVVGGGGADELRFEGATSVKLAARCISGIESLSYTDDATVVMNDRNLAAGQTMHVFYVGSAADNALDFNGHKELDGSFNFLLGGADDRVIGGQMADTIVASGGADTIVGGGGGDRLTGGDGADTFLFKTALDSAKSASDLITDLQAGDLVDIHAIDADKTLAGHQGFHFVEAFTHQAGELTLTYDAGANLTTLAGDTDGNGHAEFIIRFTGDQTDFAGFVLGA